MTDAQYLAWLASDNPMRTVLIKATPTINGVPTTILMATRSYTTGAGDAPAHTTYEGICSPSGFVYSESLALTGDGSIPTGSIQVYNLNGERDAWLTYIWTNCSVQAFTGDWRWPLADFRMIYNGFAAGIDSGDQGTLSIKLRDMLERMNTPITEHKLGGTTPNKDEIIPLLFGEGHNIAPLLVDPTVDEFQLHDGAMESINQVRDNGIPITVTSNAATGKFRLSRALVGTLTVSACGDKTGGIYVDTVAGVIQRLATSYGQAALRFSTSEIDLTNFAAFNTAPIGLYVNDKTNMRAACQQLTASLGAQLVPSRLGKLRILQVGIPSSVGAIDIPAYWTEERSMKIAARPDVVAAVKLGFCRNWTPEKDLATVLTTQHKDLFAEDWLTETSTDATVQAAYKLNADPEQKDTLLLRRIDAAAEALRQRDLWKVQRTVFEFIGHAQCLQFELGSAVRIFNSRFNLSAGAVGMVISLAPNWHDGTVTMQVLT